MWLERIYASSVEPNESSLKICARTDVSSSIPSPNVTRGGRWKNSWEKYLRHRIVSSTIAKEISSNGADSKRRQSGDTRPSRDFTTMQTKDFFLVSLRSSVYLCVSSSLPSPRHFTSPRFFLPRRKASARRRIMAECSTRRCKRFFGTIATAFCRHFSSNLASRSIYDRDSKFPFWRLIVQFSFLSYLFSYDFSRANFLLSYRRENFCRFRRFEFSWRCIKSFWNCAYCNFRFSIEIQMELDLDSNFNLIKIIIKFQSHVRKSRKIFKFDSRLNIQFN